MHTAPSRDRPPELLDPAVAALLAAAHRVEARLDAALARVGLSLAKAGVLRHLATAHEPLPLRELAERRSCGRSNITQLMDRLEADGLVRRVDDPDDRRSVRATLTPAGRRAYADAGRLLAVEERALIGHLDAAARISLQRSLDRLAG